MVLEEIGPGVLVDEAFWHRGEAASNLLRQAVEPGVVPRHEPGLRGSAASAPADGRLFAFGLIGVLPGVWVAYIAVVGSHVFTPNPCWSREERACGNSATAGPLEEPAAMVAHRGIRPHGPVAMRTQGDPDAGRRIQEAGTVMAGRGGRADGAPAMGAQRKPSGGGLAWCRGHRQIDEHGETGLAEVPESSLGTARCRAILWLCRPGHRLALRCFPLLDDSLH